MYALWWPMMTILAISITKVFQMLNFHPLSIITKEEKIFFEASIFSICDLRNPVGATCVCVYFLFLWRDSCFYLCYWRDFSQLIWCGFLIWCDFFFCLARPFCYSPTFSSGYWEQPLSFIIVDSQFKMAATKSIRNNLVEEYISCGRCIIIGESEVRPAVTPKRQLR